MMTRFLLFHQTQDTTSAERMSPHPVSGGRSWWAHFEFTRINIELTILRKKIEELMNVRGVGEKNFLKLKPQITIAPAKADHDHPGAL